jgi:hypothetical protein
VIISINFLLFSNLHNKLWFLPYLAIDNYFCCFYENFFLENLYEFILSHFKKFLTLFLSLVSFNLNKLKDNFLYRTAQIHMAFILIINFTVRSCLLDCTLQIDFRSNHLNQQLNFISNLSSNIRSIEGLIAALYY